MTVPKAYDEPCGRPAYATGYHGRPCRYAFSLELPLPAKIDKVPPGVTFSTRELP
jgi:hypothetical protein